MTNEVPMSQQVRAALPLAGLRRRWSYSHARTRGDDEAGQTLVEFALMLPVFLVIVFAIVEFGFILTNQLTLSYAAREGARAAVLKGSSSSNGVTAAQNAATNLLSCSLITPTVTSPSGTPPQVTATVSCTYSPVTPLSAVIKLISGPLNLPTTFTATSTMRQEQ